MADFQGCLRWYPIPWYFWLEDEQGDPKLRDLLFGSARDSAPLFRRTQQPKSFSVSLNSANLCSRGRVSFIRQRKRNETVDFTSCSLLPIIGWRPKPSRHKKKGLSLGPRNGLQNRLPSYLRSYLLDHPGVDTSGRAALLFFGFIP